MVGNVLPLRSIPEGAVVGDRGSFARASGDYTIVISHNPDNGTSRFTAPAPAHVVAACLCGLGSLFSTLFTNFPFPSQPAANQQQRPQADPSTNLFVSGLSKRTTDKGLRECFAKFGEVVLAGVVKDRASGWSKGFGFVRYSTLEGAAAGIDGMNGKFLDGCVIFAEYGRP